MSYPSFESIIIFLKSLVTFAIKPVWDEYSLILLAKADISLAATLALIDTALLFLPFRSKVNAPLVPSFKGPSITLVLAETFTPVPAKSVLSLLAE